MLIEIFTRHTDKKNTILTIFSTEPQLQSTGEKITIPGLVLHITANYLLFNISSPARAEHIVPFLFSIEPINAAGQLFEPVSDMKIIVTARSYTPVQILPHLHEVSHLDIERGELLGVRLVEWRSRDVAVVARAEIAVHGGIVTARIKFNSHFRDSQYNSQACIQQVSVAELVKPISPEFIIPPPRPQLTGPVARAQLSVTGAGWVEFINRQPAPVNYQQETDSYMVDFGTAGYIDFKQKPERREIICSVELTDPQIVSADLIELLHNLLGLEELTVLHTAENIMIPPKQLIDKLSFRKEQDFHSFSMSADCFTGQYNIHKLCLTLSGTVNINRDGLSSDAIHNIYTQMVGYMHKVLEYTI